MHFTPCPCKEPTDTLLLGTAPAEPTNTLPYDTMSCVKDDTEEMREAHQRVSDCCESKLP